MPANKSLHKALNLRPDLCFTVKAKNLESARSMKEAAHQILLAYDMPVSGTDYFPLTFTKNHPVKSLQNFMASFYMFIRLNYKSNVKPGQGLAGNGGFTSISEGYKSVLGTSKNVLKA